MRQHTLEYRCSAQVTTNIAAACSIIIIPGSRSGWRSSNEGLLRVVEVDEVRRAEVARVRLLPHGTVQRRKRVSVSENATALQPFSPETSFPFVLQSL